MSAKTASDHFVSDDAAYVLKEDSDELELTDAANDPVSYLDWDETDKTLVEKTGDDAQRHHTVVKSSEDESTPVNWESGWYVVPKETTVMINGQVQYTGDVHLILCDDATLEVKQGIRSDYNNDCTNSLIMYAQSEGTQTGKLTLDSAIDGGAGTITINGGEVTASTSGSDDYGCGIYAGENNVVIGADVMVMAGDAAPGSDVTSAFANSHNQKWVHTEKGAPAGSHTHTVGEGDSAQTPDARRDTDWNLECS